MTEDSFDGTGLDKSEVLDQQQLSSADGQDVLFAHIVVYLPG